MGVHNSQEGDLYVDNNNSNTLQAGLVEGSYNFSSITLKRYGHLDVMGNDSQLTVTTGNGMTGDSTMPDLTVYGTFNYTGSGELFINGVDVGLRGNAVGVTDFTLGNTMAAGLTLYAHTWAKSGSWTFGNATVAANGMMSLVSYDNGDSDWTNDYGVTFNADNLSVASSGIINANYYGYTQGGPGGTYRCSDNTSSGGSYGGYGESSCNNDGPYGSVYEPTHLGSSGGQHYFYAWRSAPGAGGGAIKLDINNTLDLAGTVRADGENASTDGNTGAGGGSGGSIWIDTTNISGGGVLQANGGTGRSDGAGGRIALYYQTNVTGNEFNFDVDHIYARGHSGGPGTVYVEHVGVHTPQEGDLYIDNNGSSGANGMDFPAQDWVFEDVFIGSNVTVDFFGDTSAERGVVFDLTGNFTLQSGALMNDSTGFSAGSGPGAGGAGSGNSGGGGAGYGGAGQAGTSDGTNPGGTGGLPYGQEAIANQLGSGGGNSGTGGAGGSGGGSMKIDSPTGTVTIDGTIEVNGHNGAASGDASGGGGSGGSIYVESDHFNLESAGTLSAQGGNIASATYPGGCGAGGRIAINSNHFDTMQGTVTVDPGCSDGAEVGTIWYSITAPINYCTLEQDPQNEQITINWTDDTDVETAFTIERSVNGGEYQAITGDFSEEVLYALYDGTDGHPSNHTGMLNDFNPETLYTKSARSDMVIPNQSSWDDRNIFMTTWMDVENSGTWSFAIDGDDAVEVEVDGSVVASYYGGHGFCNCQSHNGNISLDAGMHEVIVRHEEDGGGEGVILYFQAPDDSSWHTFTSSNLSGDASLYATIPEDSEMTTEDFIANGLDSPSMAQENQTTLIDTDITAGNTYQYRIKTVSFLHSAPWCYTGELTLGEGLFDLEGLNLEGLGVD